MNIVNPFYISHRIFVLKIKKKKKDYDFAHTRMFLIKIRNYVNIVVVSVYLNIVTCYLVRYLIGDWVTFDWDGLGGYYSFLLVNIYYF